MHGSWDIAGHAKVLAGEVDTRLLERELQPDGGIPAGEVRDAWVLAAVASLSLDDADNVARPSPWDTRDGFRLNQPAAIRVPLASGGERTGCVSSATTADTASSSTAPRTASS